MEAKFVIQKKALEYRTRVEIRKGLLFRMKRFVGHRVVEVTKAKVH